MILVVNAGSSNTKFAIYDATTLKEIYRTKVATVKDLLDWCKEQRENFKISAIGHRIVHGGTKFTSPILIKPDVLDELEKLIPLAPLHQAQNLEAITVFMNEYPNLPQIACFDTAFHATQLPIAREYAIPNSYTRDGIIKYGFHGLSYEYIASVLEQNLKEIAFGKVIVAHCGNGSSMCAMHDLISVATSMGFSTLDGLMMGTRCGSIDPGVLLYLMQEKKYKVEELADFLYHKCGLQGVSGISNDVQVLLQDGSTMAKTAIELYCYKAASEFGSLFVTLGGCDALVFTGGIGENAAFVRERICTWLQPFGIRINQDLNQNNSNIISSDDSIVKVSVIKTNEEYIIAMHTQKLS